jgi:FPC/CPF motif-containing protein YcgG
MRLFQTLIGISLALTLSGCSPVAAPTDLPKASATYTAFSPAEAKAQFETIANASCDKAMAEGVVEQSIASDGFTLVMVPKEEGYKDFSAAYFEPADNYELIWEADALSACSASISFSLAAEAGVESEIKVTFDGRDSTFETFEDLGEFGTSRLRYNVDNGLLSRIEVLDATSIDARMIRYGNLQDADWNILRTAVDRYLEDK